MVNQSSMRRRKVRSALRPNLLSMDGAFGHPIPKHLPSHMVRCDIFCH